MFEILKLSFLEIKIAFLISPFYKTLEDIKYLSNSFKMNSSNHIQKDLLFVCIIEKKDNEEEILLGKEELSKRKEFEEGKQLLYENFNNIKYKNIKKILKYKIIGVSKFSIFKDVKITRLFTSLHPDFINKGISSLFNKIDLEIHRDFFKNNPNGFFENVDDFSINAVFSTKEKILKNRALIMKEFPLLKEKMNLINQNKYNIDLEIDDLLKFKDYYSKMPFFGNDFSFSLIKMIGFKSIVHYGNLIDKKSNNQLFNIYYTIKKIIENTKLDKFIMSFSFLSERKYDIIIEENLFSSEYNQKSLRYGLYFVEYDKKNGIIIRNEWYPALLKKDIKAEYKNIEENILLRNLNDFVEINNINIINELNLFFKLKDNYINNHHSFSDENNVTSLSLEGLKEKALAWEKYISFD